MSCSIHKARELLFEALAQYASTQESRTATKRWSKQPSPVNHGEAAAAGPLHVMTHATRTFRRKSFPGTRSAGLFGRGAAGQDQHVAS